MVTRLVTLDRESAQGTYNSNESWRTSFFYISDLGINCWVSLPRFVSGVQQWRQDYKQGLVPPKPHIPEPRPGTAIWLETRERK